MKVMVMVKATKNSEAGMMPSEKLLTEMEIRDTSRISLVVSSLALVAKEGE